MLILSAQQIHNWDAYTIKHKPISSLDLMETAANRCVYWLQQQNFTQPFQIFCGKGNNGGDGLAIARLLSAKGAKVQVYILEMGQQGTPDFQENLARLHTTDVSVIYIQSAEHFPVFPNTHIVIDALFGTGLNRPLAGLPAQLVGFINQCGNLVVAIDMPSGMMADASSKTNPVIEARHTLSFQCLKLAFLMAENEPFTGEVEILDIGLLPNYLSTITAEAQLLEEDLIRTLYRPRKAFSHKGTFGHAALFAGSKGFMGAACLSANACLRGGVGKLTCHIPACGYDIVQLAAPEAMTSIGGDNWLEPVKESQGTYSAVGIGPGIGTQPGTSDLLEQLLSTVKQPMVIDADALNLLAKNNALLKKLPPFSVLTPHPGEFDRLFGKSANDFDRLRLAQEKAKALQVIIVLKGHRTLIAMPGGNCFFNSTGNAGMATGGSGDVLTGLLTALLAQSYPPEQAALLGVFLHGAAGDIAAQKLSPEALIAGDIYLQFGEVFRKLSRAAR